GGDASRHSNNDTHLLRARCGSAMVRWCVRRCEVRAVRECRWEPSHLAPSDAPPHPRTLAPSHSHDLTGTRVRLLSFSTIPGSTAITRSISGSVFAAPRLKRIEFWARCALNPIAFNPCDGSSVPDEPADPVDTAMP